MVPCEKWQNTFKTVRENFTYLLSDRNNSSIARYWKDIGTIIFNKKSCNVLAIRHPGEI